MWAGFDANAANGLKAGFWAAFVAGRFLTAALSLRVAPQALVVGAFAALALLMGTATVVPIVGVLYPLAGLLMAPVYIGVLTWFGKSVSSAPGSSAPIMAAGLAGSAQLDNSRADENAPHSAQLRPLERRSGKRSGALCRGVWRKPIFFR